MTNDNVKPTCREQDFRDVDDCAEDETALIDETFSSDEDFVAEDRFGREPGEEDYDEL